MGKEREGKSSIPSRPNLHRYVYDSMVSRLESGTWSEYLPGEYALAQLMGVSRPTLRGALEQLEAEGWISKQNGKRTKVLKKGKRHRYQRKVIFATSQKPDAFLHGTHSMLHELEHRLFLNTCDFELLYLRERTKAQRQRRINEYCREHPDAIWILHRINKPLHAFFSDNMIPAISLGRTIDKPMLPYVSYDKRAALVHALSKLLRMKHEPHRIVLVCSQHVEDEAPRQGFVDILAPRVKGSGYSIERNILKGGGQRAVFEKMLHQQMGRAEGPTAYVVTTPKPALAILGYLSAKGQAVPKNCSLICLEGEEYFSHTYPLITHYTVSPSVIAGKLFRIIDTFLKRNSPKKYEVDVIPKYVDGETLGRPIR